MYTTEKTEMSNEEKSIDDLSTDLLNILLKKFPNMNIKTKNRLKIRLKCLLRSCYNSMNKT